MARGDPQLHSSIPGALMERLTAAADDNNRSVTAELRARLEASFEASTASLTGDIAVLISRHIDAEVKRRLREIALKIGGE